MSKKNHIYITYYTIYSFYDTADNLEKNNFYVNTEKIICTYTIPE